MQGDATREVKEGHEAKRRQRKQASRQAEKYHLSQTQRAHSGAGGVLTALPAVFQ